MQVLYLCEPSASRCSYTIAANDTCSSISRQFGLPLIQDLNPGIDENCTTSLAGPLNLCLGCLVTVVSGDSCKSIALTSSISVASLVALNPSLDASCSKLRVGMVLNVCPGGGQCGAAQVQRRTHERYP